MKESTKRRQGIASDSQLTAILQVSKGPEHPCVPSSVNMTAATGDNPH